jgi:hypothetical protein
MNNNLNGKIHGKQIVKNTILRGFNGLTLSNQYFDTVNDPNISLTIDSNSATHSFLLNWQGLLSIERGGLNNAIFSANELVIADENSESLISSGWKLNNTGTSSTDIWSADAIMNYIESTLDGVSFTSGPILPDANLSSDTIIPFNQTNINNILNFNWNVFNRGATVSTVSLEWRRGGVGNWQTLTTNKSLSTLTHTLTDTNFNSLAFNYRYVVTDTKGSSKTALKDIYPIAYSQPQSILNVILTNQNLNIEGNFLREKGNVSTNLSGSITRMTPNVNLTGYKYQFRVNLGNWEDIGGIRSIQPTGGIIDSITHNPTNYTSADSIQYRIEIYDEYIDTLNTAQIILFKNVIFFGPGEVTTSNEVRNLSQKSFSDTITNYNLQTGTTSNAFTIAFPSNRNYVSSIDNTSTIFTVTYLLKNLNIVKNYYEEDFNYKIYTFKQAVSYDVNHNHLITIS